MKSINLAAFTGSSSHRGTFDLSRPWLCGEYVYATDGAITIRVLAEDYGYINEPTGKVPQKFLDDLFAEVADLRIVSACPPRKPCGWCDGTGLVEFECDHCNQHNSQPCFACHVVFRDLHYGQRYMNLVHSLPGVRVRSHFTRSSGDMLAFRFDGGHGVLMPRG